MMGFRSSRSVVWAWVSSSLLASGCALSSNRADSPSRAAMADRLSGKSAQVPVEDVPYQARENVDAPFRKRIMVLPILRGSSAFSDANLDMARQSFIRALTKNSEVMVISELDLKQDVASFREGDRFDLEKISKLASPMGVTSVVELSIDKLESKRLSDPVGLVRGVRLKLALEMKVRAANTKNNTLLIDETFRSDLEEVTTQIASRSRSDQNLYDDPQLTQMVLAKALIQVRPRILQNLEKLSWEGRIALVKGERIYINAGRLSGLQVGDILKISEDGEDVFDPETGRFIGRVPGRLKGTVEVVSYFGKDGSVSVVHSGSGFKENDLVEVY